VNGYNLSLTIIIIIIIISVCGDQKQFQCYLIRDLVTLRQCWWHKMTKWVCGNVKIAVISVHGFCCSEMFTFVFLSYSQSHHVLLRHLLSVWLWRLLLLLRECMDFWKYRHLWGVYLSTVTDYGLDDLGSIHSRDRIFFSPPHLGPTQPPCRLVPNTFTRVCGDRSVRRTTRFYPVPKVRIRGVLPPRSRA
jgi:hypothetical protein